MAIDQQLLRFIRGYFAFSSLFRGQIHDQADDDERAHRPRQILSFSTALTEHALTKVSQPISTMTTETKAISSSGQTKQNYMSDQ
jgi:hypothetical protein